VRSLLEITATRAQPEPGSPEGGLSRPEFRIEFVTKRKVQGTPDTGDKTFILEGALRPPTKPVPQRMKPDSMEKGMNHRIALLKALVLVVFIAVAVYVVRFTPVRGYFTAETLGRLLDRAGIWAPVAFILVYAIGVCLFVPGTLITAIGAAIFGPYWGFVYVWLGAMTGASAAFFIGRGLGRDFAASLIGGRLRKYDDAIERNGFATVLYLRLVYFPFTAMNFGMGLTKVRFAEYLFGTGLGILVGTFVFTFFVGTVKQVWVSGDWGGLLSFKVFFSVALFVFSFFIPKLIKRFRAEP
jgi:uncharacterized membrane protein YdjX (TVP38/TMEM64 family)